MAEVLNVTASRAQTAPEPSAAQLPNGPGFNISAVLNLLGAGSLSTALNDRGIFNLTSWTPSSRNQNHPLRGQISESLAPPGSTIYWLHDTSHDSLLGASGLGRSFCGSDCVYEALNKTANETSLPMHIFQTSFRSTGNIAIALQAFLTTVLMASYYAFTDYFDIASPATVTLVVDVERPVGKAFAILVFTILTLHLVLVIGIIFLFGQGRGEDMALGGAWAAVSQIRGPETNKWLAVASRVRDGEILEKMEATGDADILVGLKLKEGGELRLRRTVPVQG